MKPASLSNPILSFFSRHGLYFHPTKDRCSTRPASPFLYISCYFGQIFCTNIIQFFSVQNMDHDQLKKCSKYHLVSLMDEKQRSTFDIFWTLFNPTGRLNPQCNVLKVLKYQPNPSPEILHSLTVNHNTLQKFILWNVHKSFFCT